MLLSTLTSAIFPCKAQCLCTETLARCQLAIALLEVSAGSACRVKWQSQQLNFKDVRMSSSFRCLTRSICKRHIKKASLDLVCRLLFGNESKVLYYTTLPFDSVPQIVKCDPTGKSNVIPDKINCWFWHIRNTLAASALPVWADSLCMSRSSKAWQSEMLQGDQFALDFLAQCLSRYVKNQITAVPKYSTVKCLQCS